MLKPAAETAMVVATVMMAAIRPYSTIEMPDSFRTKLRKRRNSIKTHSCRNGRNLPQQG